MEMEGMSYSESLSKKRDKEKEDGREEKEMGEEDDKEEMAVMDSTSMSKVIMSRKKRKLYEAMQVWPIPIPLFSLSIFNFLDFFRSLYQL